MVRSLQRSTRHIKSHIMETGRGWWRPCRWLGPQEPAAWRLKAQPPCSKAPEKRSAGGNAQGDDPRFSQPLPPQFFPDLQCPCGRKPCQSEAFRRAKSSDVGVVQHRWVCFEVSEVKRADVTVLLEHKVLLQNSLTMTPCNTVGSLTHTGNIKHRSDCLAYNIMPGAKHFCHSYFSPYSLRWKRAIKRIVQTKM